MGWTARLLVGLVLVLAGAAAATWGLAHSSTAARYLGVVSAPSAPVQEPVQPPPQQQPQTALNPVIAEQIGQLQARLQRMETENQESQGSAGRADALLIAFAARRAIERGVRLGYLEPLLLDRFGTEHSQAVATIITGSRSPVRLTGLIAQYQDLEPKLVGPAPNEGLWTGIKRGLSSMVTIHAADRPSSQPQARYDRALSYLMAGEVDSGLAETMRLPGAPFAREWIDSARRYIAVHRALDEIESAALVGAPKAE
jgi:TolA-binding protein